MKTIDEIIKRTQPEKLKELSTLMEARGTSEQKIKESYMNIFSLSRLFSSLGREELAILKLLYSGNDGISFNDINKTLNIDINSIEAATLKLTQSMLGYVIKNRQMLNKKMDKLFCISEVAEVLKISEYQMISDHLHGIDESLAERKHETHPPKIDEKLKTILKKIAERGGIITADELSGELSSPELEQKANEACRSGQLTAYSIIGEKHTAYIAIEPTLAAYAATINKKGNLAATANVNNGYNLAINLLLAYDVISSSGLFLTKQNKFRKIDLKKISDSLLTMRDIRGETAESEDTAMFILTILNIMNCLKLDRDIGVITLKPVADIIDDPVLMLKHIAAKLADTRKKDDIFTGSIVIPSFHDLKTLINLLGRIKSAELNYLKSAFMTSKLSVTVKKTGDNPAEKMADDTGAFMASLDFLTLCGVSGISDGIITLTEPGKRLHSILHGKKHTKEIEPVPCVYISPDFTLMIPDKDIDPSSLYLIMAYTEIIRQDVVIEAAITKSSIINASKRGMNFEKFIATLRKYAKNEIPQNLEFLLDDWTKQTISINISRPVLLYSSHSTYIDELMYGAASKAVKERISENYVILNREHIDDVVRFSKKFDVKLNIFEDGD
ncbi:MAG TPA: helicase-associated domain-containing protein [Spirochaetota bacterium]|nr:helicase-associated domain-containing protein [Spirochaetota bacterium]